MVVRLRGALQLAAAPRTLPRPALMAARRPGPPFGRRLRGRARLCKALPLRVCVCVRLSLSLSLSLRSSLSSSFMSVCLSLCLSLCLSAHTCVVVSARPYPSTFLQTPTYTHCDDQPEQIVGTRRSSPCA